jgi:hypothetical protein
MLVYTVTIYHRIVSTERTFISRVTAYKNLVDILFFKHSDCARLKQKYIQANFHSITLFMVYTPIELTC